MTFHREHHKNQMQHFVYIERGKTKVQIMACPLKHSMLRFRRYMCVYMA